MDQHDHADDGSKELITDHNAVREKLIRMIEYNTGGPQQPAAISEGSLFHVLHYSVGVDTDVAADVLAQLVNDGEVVIGGDKDGRPRYRLAEGGE